MVISRADLLIAPTRELNTEYVPQVFELQEGLDQDLARAHAQIEQRARILCVHSFATERLINNNIAINYQYCQQQSEE